MSKVASSVALAAFISVLLTIGVSARAQTFPTKSVRLVVGFAAGGGTDTIARVIGKKLADTWPYALVVEAIGNKPDEFAQVIQRDMQKWGKLIRALGAAAAAK